MRKKKLLPQANSLDTVIRVFVYISVMDGCSLDDIAGFCNFEQRQASYYLNACYYLDLVDETGNITPFGQSIIDNYEFPQPAIYERIINDDVIGKIFSHMLVFPKDDQNRYAIEYLTPLFPEYGDAVIKRRASTLRSWCEDILKAIK